MTSAAKIIREALVLAHVINPQEETEGYHITQGLTCLNELIAQWGNNGLYIPYFNQLSIQLTPNVYLYTTNKVISQILEANTTQDNNVKALMKIADDVDFNAFDYTIGSGRPDFVYLSREQYFTDQTDDNLGSKLYVYPAPDSNYQLNLLLKYYLDQQTLFEEMLQFPPYFLKPLKYQLALDLANIYSSSLPQTFMSEYARLMMELKATIPIDMSLEADDPFYEYRNYSNRYYYVV